MKPVRPFDEHFRAMGRAALDAHRQMNVLEACQAHCSLAAFHLLWIVEHRSDPDCALDAMGFLRQLCIVEVGDDQLPDEVVLAYYSPLLAFSAHGYQAYTETMQGDALYACEQISISSYEFLEQAPAHSPQAVRGAFHPYLTVVK